MVRISGYRQTGPYRERPGFAPIADFMGGLRFVSGFPDRPPVRVGVSLGALIAMYHLKVNYGRGQFIDVALYESVFAVMESLIPEYQMYRHIRERSGSALPGITPSNTYLWDATLASGEAIDLPGIVPKLSETPGRTEWLGPPLGAHTAEVLASIGIDATEFAKLRSAGVV